MLAEVMSKRAEVARSKSKAVVKKQVAATTTYKEMDEDKFLINRIKTSRDADAYSMIALKYRDKIWRLARGVTRSDADADDVVQEVFLTLLQKIDSFEGRSSFSSWLYRVSINAAYMKVRSRKFIQSFDNSDLELIESEYERKECMLMDYDPEEIADGRKSLEAIHEAIDKLPEKYRSVLLLRDIEEMSTQEVADMLGLKPAAVKSRLHRARLFLRKKLVRLYESNLKGDEETEPNYSHILSGMRKQTEASGVNI